MSTLALTPAVADTLIPLVEETLKAEMLVESVDLSMRVYTRVADVPSPVLHCGIYAVLCLFISPYLFFCRNRCPRSSERGRSPLGSMGGLWVASMEASLVPPSRLRGDTCCVDDGQATTWKPLCGCYGRSVGG